MTNSPIIAKMAVDLKRKKIRIHKLTIHLLGDPKYLQLLVDPEGMTVGVRAVDSSVSGDQAHKVNQTLMASGHSYEISSTLFMRKLREVMPEIEENCSYRFSGIVLEKQRAAVFSLKTMTRIEGER